MSKRPSRPVHVRPGVAKANPRVSAFGPVTRDMYPAIFNDCNDNQLPDVDDAGYCEQGEDEPIEEVRLSDEIGALIDTRDQYVDALGVVKDNLAKIGHKITGGKAQIKARVKTPYSTIQKLRVWALPKLKDMAGARLTFPDYAGVEKAVIRIFREMEIVEGTFKNLYERPEGGYRAYHVVVLQDGMPIEIQVKTERMAKIADYAHTPYKRRRLNADVMEQATTLAHEADLGDRQAARRIDAWLGRSKAEIVADLTR